MSTPLACRRLRVGPGRLERAAGWVAGLTLVVLGLGSLAGGSGPVALLVALVSMLTLGVIVAGSADRAGRGVALIDDGLSVPRLIGSRRLRTADVESAHAVGGDGVVLRLADGSSVELVLDEPPARVLEHLGMTLERRALTAPLRGTLGGFTRGLLAMLFMWPFATVVVQALTRSWISSPVGLVLGLAAAFAVARWLRPRAVVGVDGVRIVGVLRPRFVPFGAIRQVTTVPWQGFTALMLDTGRRHVMLPVVGQSAAEIDALLARIAEGRRLHREAARARDVRALDRAGRAVATWREALRGLGVASGGFRDSALGLADLEEIVVDPQARIEHRVGAALALRDAVEGSRQRIGIASATSADPLVREALEAAAADEVDEPTLERVLRAE